MILELLVACGTPDAPDATLHADWVAQNLVLAEGTVPLLDLEECPGVIPFDRYERGTHESVGEDPFFARAFALADGSTLVGLAARCQLVDGPRVADRWLLVHPDGSYAQVSGSSLANPWTDTPDPQGVPFSGGLFVADCARDGLPIGLWLSPAGVFEPVDIGTACETARLGSTVSDVAFGRGSTDGRLAFARFGGGLHASAWVRGESAFVQDGTDTVLAGPLDQDLVRFVEETGVGQFTAVVQDDTSGGFDAVDATGTVPLSDAGNDVIAHPALARREGDGSLTVATVADDGSSAALVRFAGAATPIATTAVASALPDLRATWFGFGAVATLAHDETKDQDRLDSQAEAEVWVPEGAGWRTIAPPTTPCTERARCRKVGESYVLAVVPTPSGTLTFYGLWDWYGYGGLFLVPGGP